MMRCKQILCVAGILVWGTIGLILPSLTFMWKDQQLSHTAYSLETEPVIFKAKHTLYETLQLQNDLTNQEDYFYVSLPQDYVGINLIRAQNQVLELMDRLIQKELMLGSKADWRFVFSSPQMYLMQNDTSENSSITQLYNREFSIIWNFMLGTDDGDGIHLMLDESTGKVIGFEVNEWAGKRQTQVIGSTEQDNEEKLKRILEFLEEYYEITCIDVKRPEEDDIAPPYLISVQDAEGHKMTCNVISTDAVFSFYVYCEGAPESAAERSFP